MRKVDLAKLPTPLEYYGDILENRIFIKRDDCTDLLFGGNKARKLEYFLYEALEKKADILVTYGSPQSNHCRMTAAAANKMGMECVLILSEEDDITFNGNFFLFTLLDAQIIWTTKDKVSESIMNTLNFLSESGKKPYFIQGGGHGNLGTHAYVEAFNELVEEKEQIDYVFHATGTGTTQAGLIVGSLLKNSSTKIVGISIARRESQCHQVIFECITNYLSHYNLHFEDFEKRILVDDEYVGQGYADLYDEVLKTIQLVLKKHAVPLDPVYTGKAFHGMIQYLQKHNIKNKEIVFIHTGGVPLLFNYSDRFKEWLQNDNTNAL